MNEEELRQAIIDANRLRIWLQRTLNGVPSRDDQLDAIHLLGRIEGSLTKELEERHAHAKRTEV